MKTIRQIRDEANELYQKSSHYIAGTFISIGAVVAIAQGLLDVLGVELGMSMIFILGMFLAPLELGMVKASLLAFERKAKLVNTTEFTLMGLKEYGKIAVPFVGRTLVLYVMEAILVVIFILLSGGTFAMVPSFLQTVLSGSTDAILNNSAITLTIGMIAGVVLTLIISFFIDAYFSLSYYLVVEDEMSLFESLDASIQLMRGNMARYIGIKICYIPWMILATIIISAISVAFTTMFQQLVTVLSSVPLFVFNVILAFIVGFVSALVSTMLYKVKETLAITIFYKDLRANITEEE